MSTSEMAKKRYRLLGQKVVKALQNRRFEAYYCDNREEAKKKALELIPSGSSITWGGSATLAETGILDALANGDYQVYDRASVSTEEEKEAIYRKAFSCDFYLSSSNAISENGVIVNIDGNANRVAAICYGPSNVIFVCGMNKVLATEEAAVARARTIAAPQNQLRFMGKTPCSVDGTCHNCTSDDCICCEILITRMSRKKNRIKVILVGEELGF